MIRYPNVTATEFDDAVQQALRESQFEWVPDLNRPGAVGFGRMPMNSIDGRRLITVDLLTKPRPNLELRADSLAAAVVFDGQRATEIRLSDGSTVHASTAVVLAAGVYGSPCLLMRSGIGPRGVLAELGIPVRIDLPGVGDTLCDHPAVSVDLGYRGVQREGALLHTLVTFASPFAAQGEGPDLALWTSDPEGDPRRRLEVVLLRPRDAAAYGSPRSTRRSSRASGCPLSPTRTPWSSRTACVARSTSETHRRCRQFAATPSGGADRAAATGPLGPRERLLPSPHGGNLCHGRLTGQRCRRRRGGPGPWPHRLYIVDASILPGPPTGFPHLITLMMASRIADGLLASPDLTA